MFCKYLKTEKDRFRQVATGLSSRHVLDLTNAHFYLIFGPLIIKNRQEMVDISVRKFSSVRFFAPKTGNRGPQPV
jgi:hypothetical protein